MLQCAATATDCNSAAPITLFQLFCVANCVAIICKPAARLEQLLHCGISELKSGRSYSRQSACLSVSRFQITVVKGKSTAATYSSLQFVYVCAFYICANIVFLSFLVIFSPCSFSLLMFCVCILCAACVA